MSDCTDTEYQWRAERRREVLEYLDRQRVKHGRLGEAPAWHVYPHLSLWAVESAQSPGRVGWWVICGDCPTDYVTCSGDRAPRTMSRADAKRCVSSMKSFVERAEKLEQDIRAANKRAA